MKIKRIINASGNWNVLFVDNEIFFEGHYLPYFVFSRLLQNKFGCEIEDVKITDYEMEERNF